MTEPKTSKSTTGKILEFRGYAIKRRRGSFRVYTQDGKLVLTARTLLGAKQQIGIRFFKLRDAVPCVCTPKWPWLVSEFDRFEEEQQVAKIVGVSLGGKVWGEPEILFESLHRRTDGSTYPWLDKGAVRERRFLPSAAAESEYCEKLEAFVLARNSLMEFIRGLPAVDVQALIGLKKSDRLHSRAAFDR